MRAWSIPGPDKEIFTKAQLADYLNVTPDTIESWVKAGVFPSPISPSSKTQLWSGADIAAWQYLLPRLGILNSEENPKKSDSRKQGNSGRDEEG